MHDVVNSMYVDVNIISMLDSRLWTNLVYISGITLIGLFVQNQIQ